MTWQLWETPLITRLVKCLATIYGMPATWLFQDSSKMARKRLKSSSPAIGRREEDHHSSMWRGSPQLNGEGLVDLCHFEFLHPPHTLAGLQWSSPGPLAPPNVYMEFGI